MAAATNYLSEQIIFIILSWLPVLSLLRFKKVCKSWYNIISSPDFIQIHLANSHKRQPSVLRFARIAGDEEIYIDSQEDSIQLDLPQYPNDKYIHTRCCNGLVCVANDSGDVIHLFNPSTKWFKTLPTPQIESFAPYINLGFGFDSVGNDYKLFRVVTKFERNGGFPMYAEVYSANANSWKPINVRDQLTVQSFYAFSDATCVQDKKGVLYLEGMRGSEHFLSFDLHNEVLGLCEYPKRMLHREKSDILDYEGSVAVIYYKPSHVESELSLWMLEDICGELSWTKKFNIEASWKIMIHLYLGFGYFVANDYEEGYVFYDYRKKKTKEFTIPSGTLEDVSVRKYADTLVSLN